MMIEIIGFNEFQDFNQPYLHRSASNYKCEVVPVTYSLVMSSQSSVSKRTMQLLNMFG